MLTDLAVQNSHTGLDSQDIKTSFHVYSHRVLVQRINGAVRHVFETAPLTRFYSNLKKG